MKIILLGPPGAGKGTHAKIFAEKFKIVHLATGDILRRHIRESTKLGRKAREIIEKGGLAPDELVNAMMFEEMERVGMNKGFILDGYPRTIGQAEALDRFLKDRHTNADVALNFATSEKVIIDRLSGRRVCTRCGANYHMRNIPPKKEGVCDICSGRLSQRTDDEPATIRTRLETYEKETRPLIQYYASQGLLYDAPGDYDIPEFQAAVKSFFDSLMAKNDFA